MPLSPIHRRATVPAEQLRREQELLFAAGLDLPGGRFFILFQSLLHPLKCLIIYDAWHAIRDQDIVPSVFTDIPPIGKDPRDRIVIERLSVGCFETPTIQLFDDLGGLLPTAIHLKDLPDDLCTVLINLEILVLIDIIPESMTPPPVDWPFMATPRIPRIMFWDRFAE